MTAVDGRCLLGHRVDQSTISSRRGRRISGAAAAGLAVLDRVRTTADHAVSRTQRPSPSRPSGQPLRDHLVDTGPQRAVSRPAASTAVAARPVVPRSSAGSAGLDLNPTGEMVIQLWDETPDAPALESWESEEALSAMPERSAARIVSFGLLAVALVAMIIAVSLIFGSGSSVREDLVAASTDLAQTLGAFDSSANPDFSDVDASARRLLETAQELEIGDADRALAIDASGQVLEAERSLSEALAYETGFVVFVGRPSLPASTEDLSGISEQYTSWLTSLLGVVQPVPDQPAFAEHGTLVSRFSEASSALQAQYLDALRSGDAGAATAALEKIDARVTELEASLTTAMAQARRAFDTAATDASQMLGRIGTG